MNVPSLLVALVLAACIAVPCWIAGARLNSWVRARLDRWLRKRFGLPPE